MPQHTCRVKKDNCGNGFSPPTVQALEKKKYSHQAWHQVVLVSHLPRPRIKKGLRR